MLFQKLPCDCSSHIMSFPGEETHLKRSPTWMCQAGLQGPYLFYVNQDIAVAHFCPANMARQLKLRKIREITSVTE